MNKYFFADIFKGWPFLCKG